MKTFEEIKALAITKAEAAGAYSSQSERVKGAETTEQLLEIIKDNIAWLVSRNAVNGQALKDIFGLEKLAENHIYVEGEHNVVAREGTPHLVLLGSSSANVKTWGNSSANVETWGNSSANVETLESSSANVETLESSSANVKTWGSSSKLTYELKSTGLGTIKDHNRKKLIVYKSAFEIVEVENRD